MSVGVAAYKRDHRIDLLRGISLLLILLSHSGLFFSSALRNIRGFSDASESFVMLAGMSAALAYIPVCRSKSLPTKKIMDRSIQIYLWHITLVAGLVSAGLLMSLACLHLGFADHLRPIREFGIMGIAEDPFRFASKLLSLSLMPSYFDILPLYVVLIAVLPLLASSLKRSRTATLGASIGIWLLTPILGINLSNDIAVDGQWFFNPFSWQLVFVIGLVFGHLLKQRKDLDFGRPAIFNLSLAIVIISIPLNIIYRAMGWDVVLSGNPTFYGDILLSKSTGGLLRVTNSAALIYVLWNWKTFENWSNAAWASPFVRAGRHSLPVFLASLVITYVAKTIWMFNEHIGYLAQTAMGLSGCMALLMFAEAVERRRAAMSAAPREARTWRISIRRHIGAWMPDFAKRQILAFGRLHRT